jgi:hypothetical protein
MSALWAGGAGAWHWQTFSIVAAVAAEVGGSGPGLKLSADVKRLLAELNTLRLSQRQIILLLPQSIPDGLSRLVLALDGEIRGEGSLVCGYLGFWRTRLGSRTAARSYGAVMVATDTVTGKEVSLKVLSYDGGERQKRTFEELVTLAVTI